MATDRLTRRRRPNPNPRYTEANMASMADNTSSRGREGGGYVNLLDDHKERVLQAEKETPRDENDEAVENLVQAFKTINALHSSSTMEGDSDQIPQ